MFHVKFPFISLTLGQFPPTKGLLLKGDKFNSAKLKKMIARSRWDIMASQKQGIRTGRVVNWALVCVKFSWRKRRSLQIPNCKVKYGSYPSKNIPYFIHLLSLHVFYRISGLTLQKISGLELPIWGCTTNKKNILKNVVESITLLQSC